MRIWDPIGDMLESLLYPQAAWQYVCTVNGERMFCGEALPVGTRAEIEKWFRDRYELIGELELARCSAMMTCWQLAWSWRLRGMPPPPVRLLVVAHGEERMFRLTPVTGLRLTWDGNGSGLQQRSMMD